jgi:hypothetical protein
MTDLEDRIRRDLKKFAGRADHEFIRPPLAPQVRGPSRPARWLAPAAAVVAVIVVIAGVSLARAHSPGTGTSLSAGARDTARGMPPYYVAFVSRFTRNDTQVHAAAVVHDSATGAALATVAVPTLASGAYSDGPDITAAADDRRFVITELGKTGPANHRARFYLLRLAVNGRPASLTRLPISVPRSLAVADVALSPDGTRLAMQEQSCHRGGCDYTGIRVITIATGAVRIWATSARGAPFAVSWAGNSTVAFLWGSKYRLLNVTSSGGNLLASRPIASPAAQPDGYVPAALLTPDEANLITPTVRNIPDGHGTFTAKAEIIELSTRTGKLLRILSTTTVHGATRGQQGSAENLDGDCNVLSLGPAGTNVLVSCFTFGRVDNNSFTPLPGFPSGSNSGIGGQDEGAW